MLEVLDSEGVEHIFGNPGTTELPFMDALPDHPELHYVLALQEATAVAMADGYAQATGRPAFLNLHTSAGLGNAIGNLTNARANGTPLVVTAGNADRRHLVVDPLLSGDLVGLARGVSKWGHEVRHSGELGTILRRAFNDAANPPAGPVFVSIPQDVLDEEGEAPVPAKSSVERAAVAAQLEELALHLSGGEPLALVVGDEVAAAGAVDAMVDVAERLGAPVFGSPLHSNLVFPTTHPQWRGPLAPRADAIRAQLDGFKRIFLVGSHAFLVYPYAPGSPVPDGAELFQLAPDANALGRTHAVALGLVGDPKASLEALAALLPAARPPQSTAEPTAPPKAAAEFPTDQVPMHPGAVVAALLDALPRDPIVVDEAITTGTYVRRLHRSSTPGTYYFCRGGGLGWGMPAACGVSLGRGREPVLCVVGDGSAMYSCQALWTAAHEQLPVLFAVVNNRQYAILKDNLRRMGGRYAATGQSVAMDMDEPPVDFVALARSMGVDAALVEKATDVGDAARAAWDSGRPMLLELPIAVP